jgi:hypothetical protein
MSVAKDKAPMPDLTGLNIPDLLQVAAPKTREELLAVVNGGAAAKSQGSDSDESDDRPY